ncbi:MAG: DUF3794 domain-containing protein [Christensenellales bacterium]
MDNSLILNTKKYLGRKQIVLDCKFQIENGKEVQKVLAVCGKPILNDITVTNGNANFMGKVNLKLIYLSETNERECLNCIADFNEYFDNADIEIGDTALIELKVVDVTTPSIKANEVKVACILDAVVYLSKNKTYEQVEEADNVFYKKSMCEITKQVATIKDSFEVQEEFRIEGDLKCVLNVDVDMSVKESYCGNGFAVVGGDANVNIVYEDEGGEVKMYKTTFGVKQEVAVDSVNKDCIVVAEINPLEFLSKCTVVQGENCNIVRWEAPINVSGVVYENLLVDKIEDAYSSSFNIDYNFKECETIKNLSLSTLDDTVKGEVPLKEDVNATLIGYLFSGVEVSSAYVEGEKLTIEGVVSTTILYKNNETNQVQSVIAEFPYISQSNKSEFSGLTDISVKSNIADMDISIKNNSIELVTKLMFNVFGVEAVKVKLLSEIVIGEPRKERDCAMEIIVVNEEKSLWDLGKMLGVSGEQIMLQNPNLVEPVSKGEKVVVYYTYNGA